MHKKVNRNDIEVVNSVTDDENHPKRWVLVRDGEYQVWVRVAEADEYRYELQPEECVLEAELEAISLKQAALQDGTAVSVEGARALVDSGEVEQIQHPLVVVCYAAKANPDVTDEDVDRSAS